MSGAPFREARLRHELATTSAAVRVLAATGISQYGDWFTTVALLTVLYQSTNSAVGPAAYMLFRVGPRIVGAAPGGHMADRFSPQFVTAGIIALQGVATVGLLAAVNAHSTAAIYITVAIAQLLGAASRPLFPALVGIHTPPRHRGTFNSIDQILADTAMFAAPALGALILALTSAPTVIAVDCVTFAVAALVTLTLPKSHPGGIATDSMIQGASAGFRFTWRDGSLRTGATGFATSGATITLLQALLVVASAQRYGGADRIGFCYAAVGVGGILGGTFALRMRHRPVGRLDIYMTAMMEIVPLAALSIITSLPFALVALVCSGIAGGLNWVFTTTSMQNQTPAEILGRVSAALTTINFLGMLAGALVAISLAQFVSWPLLLAAFTVACIVLLTATWLGAPEGGRR